MPSTSITSCHRSQLQKQQQRGLSNSRTFRFQMAELVRDALRSQRDPPAALPGNLTLVDIEAPLWHEPHAPLRLFAAEGVEVVNVGGFICDLKVADAAVALQESTGEPLWRGQRCPCPHACSPPGQAALALTPGPFLPEPPSRSNAHVTDYFFGLKPIVYPSNVSHLGLPPTGAIRQRTAAFTVPTAAEPPQSRSLL